MIKNSVFTSIFFIFLCSLNLVSAQQNKNNNEILLQAADEKYTVSQMLDLYNKTEQNKSAFNKKDFEEYLNLFINYRLKLKEAQSMRLDTLPGFVNEYSRYYTQISLPYLIDDSIITALSRECYERTKTYVRASHILLQLDMGADSVKTYKKALEIRKKLLKGANFEKLALEYSEDPTVRKYKDPQTEDSVAGNNGDLGFFSVFETYLPVEDAVYSMSIGEISMPIRSVKGYHILKKTGSVSSPGKTSIRHIWVAPNNEKDTLSAYNKIFEAYSKLTNGISFEMVARSYCEDQSASYGGLLPPTEPNKMFPEYLERVAYLKQGEYSKPFKTKYGYHIIYVENIKGVPEYSSIERTIKNMVARGTRLQIVNNSFIQKVGKKYGLIEYKNNQTVLRNLLTDSIFSGTWDFPENTDLSKPLFTFNGSNYTQLDLANYIKNAQKELMSKLNLNYYLELKYEAYLLTIARTVQELHLEEEYSDVKQTLANYKEGMLIFDINEKMIWNESLDSLGLTQFYENTKNNHKVNFNAPNISSEANYYMWNERADVTIWTFDNNSMPSKKALEIMTKAAKKKLTESEIFDLLKAQANKNMNANEAIVFSWGIYEKADKEQLSKIDWKEGVSKVIQGENSYEILLVHKILPPQLKSLDEARGYYTNDYQGFLEKKWIQSLREKYSSSINEQVLNTIK